MQTTETTHNTEPGSLKAKALLVSITIRQWSATKRDKNATAELAESKRASEQRVRVNKTLVSCEELDKVKKLAGEIRKCHYEHTAAWGEKNRIMPAAKFGTFRAKMVGFKMAFEQAADEFVAVYESEVLEAQRDDVGLGHVFNRDDYPDKATVRDAFSLNWEFQNLSDQPDGDFRCCLSDGDRAAVQQSMQAQFKANAVAAMADTYEKVRETLEALSGMLTHERTNKAGEKVPGKITASVIERACELADNLDGFNLTDDPRMSQLVASLQQNLAGMEDDVDRIRNEPEAREEAAEQAQAVLSLMQSFGRSEADTCPDAEEDGEVW